MIRLELSMEEAEIVAAFLDHALTLNPRILGALIARGGDEASDGKLALATMGRVCFALDDAISAEERSRLDDRARGFWMPERRS